MLYTQPNGKAHIKGLNAYGGDHGTQGKVSVASTFSAELGVEVSLNQKWVIATDIVYTCLSKSAFKGNPGTSIIGDVALLGLPSSDQLSPSVEYNVKSSSGFIGGVWFFVTGRNSSKFTGLVLAYTQLF
ncbi:MAG: hypothetical protein WCG14_02715 [Chlamydiia bacterium]